MSWFPMEGADKSLEWIGKILASEPVTSEGDTQSTKKYIVIRVACPVEASITRENEKLNSDPEHISNISSFGRMDLLGAKDEIKMFCVFDETDYDIKLVGTDTGTMDYSIRLFDSEGKLEDERVVTGVPITDKTIITTSTDFRDKINLSIDQNGDGSVDTVRVVEKESDKSQTKFALALTAGSGGVISTGTSGNYLSNTSITIAAKPNANYSFKNWASSDGGTFANANSATTNFVMPGNNTTITANFIYTGGTTGGNSGNDDSGNNNSDDNTTYTPSSVTSTINDATTSLETKSNGDYIARLSGKDEYRFSITIANLTNKGLTISTEFGSVYLSNEVLQEIKTLYGDNLNLIVKKGSLFLAIVANGKEVPYNNLDKQLIITLPTTVATDKNINGYVAVSQANNKNTVLPLGVLDNDKIIFTTPTTGKYDIIYNAKTFADITSHWAKDYVTFTSSRELFSGTGNNSFSPDVPMTRAMFATILARLEGVDLTKYTTMRFSDVATGQYFSGAIEWAADKNIITGYGGKFNPNSNITREQMAVMLANYINYKSYKLKTSNTSTFADEIKVASWANDSVKAIQSAGIINGKINNVFDPQGTATRAEVATIFAQFIQALNK